MTKSKIPEFTSYPPRGVFYYVFFDKSPLRDLGVKISHAFIALLLLVLIGTVKTLSQDIESPSLKIKIGLLIQDNRYTSALQGAEMAVRKANEAGGLNGRPFQLVTRSMQGPWGTGSKQAVSLIFEEKVWALFGSHDGRNAHLVEQAATKSQVVFLSAWATDPTLSQAFVPWFFNCVPNDRQQAASLIEEIYDKRKIKQTTIIYTNDYDSKMAKDNFLKLGKMSGKPDPVQYCYDDFDTKSDALIEKIGKPDVKCIILFCNPSASVEIIGKIRKNKMDKLLFGPVMLLNENELSGQELQVFDDILSVPSGNWPESENLIFRKEYQRAFGRLPGIVASYSFDGMNVLIRAIINAVEPDREKIQRSLAGMNFIGVTGPVQFDDKGNRSGDFETRQVKNGLPMITR